jgi:hypothetical protein
MMKWAGGNIRRLHCEADIGKASVAFDAGVLSESHHLDHASSWSVASGSRLVRDNQSAQNGQPFLRETESRSLRRSIHSIFSVVRFFVAFPLNSRSESAICNAVGGCQIRLRLICSAKKNVSLLHFVFTPLFPGKLRT